MWAGGKNKMLKFYKPLMPNSIDNYSELFFGGGSMFIYIMETYKPKKSYINDINKDIINIYLSIRDNYDEFLQRLNQLEKKYIPLIKEDRKKFYYEIREEHAYHYQKWSKPVESSTLYFLMKTGFNGIYQLNKNTNGRYGTPSGLLNQTEQVYNRNDLNWWNNVLQNVEITSKDWSECCNHENTFYFLDPPYRDSFADYGNAFNDDNLLQLIEFANQQKNVMLCNRDSEDDWFEKNKMDLNIEKFPVTYTAGRRKKTKEGFEAKKATEVLLYKVFLKKYLNNVLIFF
jgi:DNA adenine methylase